MRKTHGSPQRRGARAATEHPGLGNAAGIAGDGVRPLRRRRFRVPLSGDSDKTDTRNEGYVEASLDYRAWIELSPLENVIHYVCVYL